MKWGVCIDDVWSYINVDAPSHIIIPHLFSLRSSLSLTRRGKSKTERPRPRKDPIEALVKTLTNSRVDSVRFWMQWNFIEKKLEFKGNEYVWPTDRFFKALKDSGLHLIPVVGCGYHRMLPEGADPDRRPNKYLKGIYNSTRAIVKRYKNLVDHWQIENEPNWWFAHNAVGWRKGIIWTDPIRGPKFRERLLKTLKKAVNDADPQAKIVINLEIDRVVGDLPFYKEIADVIGVDYYPNYSHASPIDLNNLIPKIRTIAQETNRRIIISETGYPSGPSILGYSEKRQVEYIEKLIETVKDNNLVESTSVWRLSDSPWRSFPDHENYFGLLKADLTPKLSWRAFTKAIEE